MKIASKSNMVFLAVVLAAVVAWNIAYPSGTWRYKMTVEVETPEGLKAGYAVREVHVRAVPKLSPHMLPMVTLKGEAVVVNLGERGVLFALLSGYKKGADYGADIPAIIYSPKQAVMDDDSIHYMDRLKAGPTMVEPQWYPKFVRFRDPGDPKTVENLMEMRGCTEDDHVENWKYTLCLKEDHFEKAFGQGVKLKSVIVEMTDEPVTWGVEKWLPWLPDYYNMMFDGQRYNTIKTDYPLANSLASGAFSTGEKK